MKYMVFDVESIGPFGKGFAVGFVVLDKNFKEYASDFYACHPSLVASDKEAEFEWIFKKYPKYTFAIPRDIRTAFWNAWSSFRAAGAYLFADCSFPIETNFLIQCIQDDISREMESPHPLYDVASIRMSVGFDPLRPESRLPNEYPPNDPVKNARQSARLLVQALEIINKAI